MSEVVYGLNYIYPRIINDNTYTPKTVSNVLDVGCGKGILGALLRIFREPESITGVDAFRPYLTHCSKLGVYDDLYLTDISRGLPFKDGHFSHVYCIEVLEHLEHTDALKTLDELTRVGHRVVVTTPTRYCEQGVIDGNPFQRHRTFLRPHEYKIRGFRVRGLGQVKHAPIVSWRLGTLWPSVQTHYIAVKEE